MYSAFGVDHGEFSKSAALTAGKSGSKIPKLGLMRPKSHERINVGDHAVKDITDREGTWALKAKRNTSSWEDNSRVVNSSSGGGLTGRGKLAVGGAGAAAAGGGYAARRKVQGY